MSKTMDNDTDSKSPYVTSRDLILAQTAEIERLKAELWYYSDLCSEHMVEKEALRARVEELEAESQDSFLLIKKQAEAMDALRADRDEAERVADWRNGEVARLKAELAATKPKLQAAEELVEHILTSESMNPELRLALAFRAAGKGE